MSPFSMDFTGVEERGEYEPIPAGIYEVVISEISESEEEGPSGYAYLIAELTINEGDYENRKLWTNLSLSPKAAFKIKEFLLACGVDPDELTSEFDFDPADYEGQVIQVQVSQRPYDGEMRNNVKHFISPGEDDKPLKKKGSGPAGSKKGGPKIR